MRIIAAVVAAVVLAAGCSELPLATSGDSRLMLVEDTMARIPSSTASMGVCVVRDQVSKDEFLVLRGYGRNRTSSMIRLRKAGDVDEPGVPSYPDISVPILK